MTSVKLPPGFEALAPYLDWSLATADARQSKRRTTSREDLQAFYNGVLPHMEAILKAVDAYPMGKLPPEYQAIYNMALAIAEVAPHIELYKGDPAVPHAFEESRFIAHHGGHRTWKGLHPMDDDE